MKRLLIRLAIICTTFALTYGCSDKDSTTGPAEILESDDGRIIVNNSESDLGSRVTYTSEEIEVDTLSVTGGAEKKIKVGEELLALVLVSEVSPPVHEGITLQATDIQIKETYAYVSYNVAGETFLRGVDIFDISDPSTPRLVSNALFTDTDVNAKLLTDFSRQALFQAFSRFTFAARELPQAAKQTSRGPPRDEDPIIVPDHTGGDIMMRQRLASTPHGKALLDAKLPGLALITERALGTRRTTGRADGCPQVHQCLIERPRLACGQQRRSRLAQPPAACGRLRVVCDLEHAA